jgi:hypothetical protein
MKTCWLLLLSCLFIATPLESGAGQNPGRKPARAGITSLSGTFSRVSDTQSEKDSVSGVFYFFDSRKTLFDVRYPIHQVMFIENNIIQIYYPELRKAFRIESANPVAFPLIPGLLAAIRPDYGLSLMGFKLSGQRMSGDTTLSRWFQPASKSKAGWFELAQYRDRLRYCTYHSPDALNYTMTTFGNYGAPLMGYSFPTEIRTTAVSGGSISRETVHLGDLRVNAPIPTEVTGFAIPSAVKAVKKKW